MRRSTVIALMFASVAGASFGQAVRSTDEAYPARAPALNLPVAPAAAEPPPVVVAARDQVREWKVMPGDRSLARALARWAKDAEYPVIWEADKELPAFNASYHGSFMAALEQLMVDSGNSAYPVHACAYDNLVRVIHDSQACKR
jgi:hypothetical protein